MNKSYLHDCENFVDLHFPTLIPGVMNLTAEDLTVVVGEHDNYYITDAAIIEQLRNNKSVAQDRYGRKLNKYHKNNIYKVDSFILHEDYRIVSKETKQTNYDYAILSLTSPIIFSPKVSPICLPVTGNEVELETKVHTKIRNHGEGPY